MIKMNILELLARKGKSKYWLVKELESNYTIVNNMVYGRTKSLHLATIDRLCTLLDCTPGELFTHVPDEDE